MKYKSPRKSNSKIPCLANSLYLWTLDKITICGKRYDRRHWAKPYQQATKDLSIIFWTGNSSQPDLCERKGRLYICFTRFLLPAKKYILFERYYTLLFYTNRRSFCTVCKYQVLFQFAKQHFINKYITSPFASMFVVMLNKLVCTVLFINAESTFPANQRDCKSKENVTF